MRYLKIGTGSTSWYADYSCFVGFSEPFSVRGGRWDDISSAGIFSFYCRDGNGYFSYGFRPILVA